jgi:hypothetical protein
MRSRRERWEGGSGASFGVAGGGGFLGAGFLGGSFFAEGAGIVFERWWVLVVEGAEEWAVTGGCEGAEFGSGEEASGCEVPRGWWG